MQEIKFLFTLFIDVSPIFISSVVKINFSMFEKSPNEKSFTKARQNLKFSSYR